MELILKAFYPVLLAGFPMLQGLLAENEENENFLSISYPLYSWSCSLVITHQK